MLFHGSFVYFVFNGLEYEADIKFRGTFKRLYNSESELAVALLNFNEKHSNVLGSGFDIYSIAPYLRYSVHYCVVNEIYDYNSFFGAVISSFIQEYNNGKFGVYPTIAFDNLDIANEFYAIFYKIMEPIFDFYVSYPDINNINDIKNINFSKEYSTLYKIYHVFGAEKSITIAEMFDFFFSYEVETASNYERTKN